MNQAIKLAIEKGGYKLPYGGNVTFKVRGEFDDAAMGWVKPQITEDPLFWQAVGTVLGWDILFDGRKWDAKKYGFMPVWRHKAHQYFNLVLTGGNLDAFWKELINK